jgi:diguanylate cyclase (GGDEF)-like protein
MERIRIKIQDEVFNLTDFIFKVTCSFGITSFNDTSFSQHVSREEIFSKADSALYQAKRQGKNKVYLLELNDRSLI